MSKYARLERDQRWLLDALPDGLRSPARIYDRYITGLEERPEPALGGRLVLRHEIWRETLMSLFGANLRGAKRPPTAGVEPCPTP